ncbi:hypothetical protein ABH935_006357 [Catenulispora sp. GAS73]|uniref:hypothetical protein n=1 Tax=Catenulispora sp. GAS73 TaxID=3156269 RepID=UPI0035138A69
MDPIVTSSMISTALAKLLDSTATQAGTKAWDALTALLTRHHRKAPDKPKSADEVATLAAELSTAAQEDTVLANDLLAWHQSIEGSDNTANIVSGTASQFVQGRDFHGGNFTFN